MVITHVQSVASEDIPTHLYFAPGQTMPKYVIFLSPTNAPYFCSLSEKA